MKRVFQFQLFVTLVMLSLSGCAATPDLVQSGGVKLTLHRDPAVEVLGVHATQTDAGCRVTGIIHRRPLVDYPLNEQIMIRAVSKDGQPLGDVVAECYPPDVPYLGIRRSSFIATLPVQLPPGSTIEVRNSVE